MNRQDPGLELPHLFSFLISMVCFNIHFYMLPLRAELFQGNVLQVYTKVYSNVYL